MSYKLFISGDIFHDYGLLQLSELVNGCKVEKNHIEFEKIDEEMLFKNLGNTLTSNDLESEKKENAIISFKYFNNSAKFGITNAKCDDGKKQDAIYSNIKKQISLLWREIKSEYNNIYEYKETCSICHQHKAPDFDFDAVEEKKKRLFSNSLYPLAGSQKSDKANFKNENIKICFTCELLGLLSLAKYLKASNNVFYSKDLFLNQELSKIFESTKDFLSNEALLKKLINYSKIDIKEYKVKYETKSNKYELAYINSHQLQDLLIFIKLKKIVEQFNGLKGQEFLYNLLRQKNYASVKATLLTCIFVKDNNSETIYNLQLYLKFIMIIMEEKVSTENAYYSGKTLGARLDDEKIKRLSLKLIQLLKADDKTTILQELLHILTVNQVEFPVCLSKNVMVANSDNELHLYIGSLIEGLNGKKTTATEE